jgi:hypothetical protein
MMKVRILAGSILLCLIALTALFIKPQPAASAEPSPPQSTMQEYLEALASRQWDQAYDLTSTGFQDKIPLDAFKHELESSLFVESLLGFDVGTAVIDGDKAQVGVSFRYLPEAKRPHVSVPTSFNLIYQQSGWHVSLPWEDFLPSKLYTQDPLDMFEHSGISVSVQYLLMYPETQSAPARTRVRLDITNNSDNTLRWELPQPGTSGTYMKDRNTGEVYPPAPGRGAMGKIGEAFNVDLKEGVLTAAPGTRGTVFIYFENTPQAVKEFDMVLSGFSFPDAGVKWDASFTGVPFRFDVSPD